MPLILIARGIRDIRSIGLGPGPGLRIYRCDLSPRQSGGVVRVAIDRPEVRNAFRPQTVDELFTALDHARQTTDVGCVLLTGNGPSPKDGGWAFSSGGDQRIRGRDGYRYAEGEGATRWTPRGSADCTSWRCRG